MVLVVILMSALFFHKLENSGEMMGSFLYQPDRENTLGFSSFLVSGIKNSWRTKKLGEEKTLPFKSINAPILSRRLLKLGLPFSPRSSASAF